MEIYFLTITQKKILNKLKTETIWKWKLEEYTKNFKIYKIDKKHVRII